MFFMIAKSKKQSRTSTNHAEDTLAYSGRFRLGYRLNHAQSETIWRLAVRESNS